MSATDSDEVSDGTAIGDRRARARGRESKRYQARRREFIDAAAHEFIEHGYETTAVGDIADRVGSDRATFYYYFDGKEQLLEIFEEVVAQITEANLNAAEDIVSMEESARDKLRLIVRTILASFVENYPVVYVYIAEELHKVRWKKDGFAPQILSQNRAIEAIVADILDEAIEQGDFRSDLITKVATHGLFGMINWTYRWLNPDGDFGSRELSDMFFTLFVDGMAVRSN